MKLPSWLIGIGGSIDFSFGWLILAPSMTILCIALIINYQFIITCSNKINQNEINGHKKESNKLNNTNLIPYYTLKMYSLFEEYPLLIQSFININEHNILYTLLQMQFQIDGINNTVKYYQTNKILIHFLTDETIAEILFVMIIQVFGNNTLQSILILRSILLCINRSNQGYSKTKIFIMATRSYQIAKKVDFVRNLDLVYHGFVLHQMLIVVFQNNIDLNYDFNYNNLTNNPNNSQMILNIYIQMNNENNIKLLISGL